MQSRLFLFKKHAPAAGNIPKESREPEPKQLYYKNKTRGLKMQKQS